MYILFTISFTITLFILNLSVAAIASNSNNKKILNRINKYSPKKEESLFETPLIVRLLKPLSHSLSTILYWFTPIKYKIHLQQKLLRIDQRYSLEEILILKFLILILLSSLTIFIIFYASFHFSFIIIILLSSFCPDIYINLVIKKRKEEIQSELPTFMDMLTIILGAGISFDNGIQQICKRKKGPLYKEFTYYLTQQNMGTPREEALKIIGARIQLKEFDTLVRSIIQGDKMGISILKTIRLQAEQLRIKRKQRVEEQAAKIPIKILFPLTIFIFPPIFIIILGPGLIQIFESFF